MALFLVACGNYTDHTENPSSEVDQGLVNITGEETTIEAETEKTTTEVIVPTATFVEPAAEDFEYTYDTVLGGVIITKYNGDAKTICIPTEIEGDPVKQVALCGNIVIEQVVLPDSVTVIGYSAFVNCDSLTEITIPESVVDIGDEAFRGCSSLTSVTIPDNVTSIGDRAFKGCSSLANITIPDGVTEIGYGTFWDCSSLTSIIISNSVTSIRDSAFKGCSSLTSVTIPDSVTEIDYDVFNSCDSLTVTYNGQEYNHASDTNWW
ncbi:MAG: leucine-rich repeat domain-containing protein [Lachnospiraceae bacterium]|nr:leucine-rich repeat domain-containing protein [Lachnospiraceae bacterium]